MHKILRLAQRYASHHRVHAALECVYLSFYLLEGWNLHSLVVVILMIHTSVEIFKA